MDVRKQFYERKTGGSNSILKKPKIALLFILLMLGSFFLSLISIPNVKASTISLSSFSGDYALYYDDGDVQRWHYWSDYWINQADALHAYGINTINLIFGFYGTGNGYGSYLTYSKFEEALVIFDSINMPVIAYLLDDYSSYPSTYISSGQLQTDWVNFATEYADDDRIAAFSLWSEYTASDIPAGWDETDMVDEFADITDAIHAVDADRVVIFPTFTMVWDAVTYTVSDWITDVTATGLLSNAYTLFDVVHPYYFEDPYGWDMGLTPSEKADWYNSTFIQPCVTGFGASKCYCGETFAASAGAFAWSVTKSLQVAFETAMINIFCGYDMGFNLQSTLGSVNMYSYNLEALIASDYDESPSSTPTPTPTSPPGPTPTPPPTPPDSYTFTGPYLDNRDVATDNVTVTLRYANYSIYTFTLVGDGVTPDTETVTSANFIQSASWNASSALNFTRFYDFTSSTDYEVDIHILDSSENAYTYNFNIADFYGMTKAYLETETTDGSDWYPVERKLITQGTMSFVLTQYYDYTLKFINEIDTNSFQYYSLTFRPENVYSIDLPVLPGSFPTTTTSGVEATAIRIDSETIEADYVDSDEISDWLYFAISHLESGFELTDYTLNMSDINSFNLVWNEADADTNYAVDIQSYRGGYVYEWKFACPAEPDSNPWDGAFDFLGSWPSGIDTSQIVVSGIVLFFLCIGSVRTLGASAVLSWIVGAIFLAVGWWAPAIPTFILAGVLSVLIAVAEGKETTREV